MSSVSTTGIKCFLTVLRGLQATRLYPGLQRGSGFSEDRGRRRDLGLSREDEDLKTLPAASGAGPGRGRLRVTGQGRGSGRPRAQPAAWGASSRVLVTESRGPSRKAQHLPGSPQPWAGREHCAEHLHMFTHSKRLFPGGPGVEAACQCSRPRFDPWSRNTPHASEQLSPCARLLRPRSRASRCNRGRPSTQGLSPAVRSYREEKPLNRSKEPARSPLLEKARHSSEDQRSHKERMNLQKFT